jgi:hypothetical protein
MQIAETDSRSEYRTEPSTDYASVRVRIKGENETLLLLLLFNTTRMVPGPPSTGVAIAMDGGNETLFVSDALCVRFLECSV